MMLPCLHILSNPIVGMFWALSVHVSQPRLHGRRILALGMSPLQWFSNFSELQNHLEGLLTQRCLDPPHPAAPCRASNSEVWGGVCSFAFLTSTQKTPKPLGTTSWKPLVYVFFIPFSWRLLGPIHMHMWRYVQGFQMWDSFPSLLIYG